MALPANASYFTNQEAQHALDPWAVVGIRPEDKNKGLREIARHVRLKVMKHVFHFASDRGKTVGPNVPTWEQVNNAKDILFDNDGADPVGRLEVIRKRWIGRSKQVWNPLADVGSVAALNPPQPTDIASSHRGSAFEHVPPVSTDRPSPMGSKANPFFLDSSEEDVDDVPKSTTCKRKARRASPTPSTRHANKKRRSTQSNHDGPLPDHIDRGIHLGLWKQPGSTECLGHAVYGKVDRSGRVTRRLFEGASTGDGCIHPRREYNHKEIQYMKLFQDMSRREVDILVNTILAAQPFGHDGVIDGYNDPYSEYV